MQKLSPHFPQVCPICEKPSIDGVTHFKCIRHTGADGLLVLWKYEGLAQILIKKLKYRFVSDVVNILSRELALEIRKQPWNNKPFLIIPIPLYWQRKNWRGFNQSEELAKALGKRLNYKVEDVLIRVKNTRQQVGLKEEDRLKNIKEAFRLKPGIKIKNANTLLIDDVWTTGSTMKEATKILKLAGAHTVWCTTIAR